MSKENWVFAPGTVLALMLAASVTQAAEPVTFTHTIHPTTADLGSWAKADGLKVTWEVAEHRSGIQTETLENVHAGLRRNDIAMEKITFAHEGFDKPRVAFNPKELPAGKSTSWIRVSQPHSTGAVGGDSFNGKYLIQGVTHRSPEARR